MTYDHPRPWHGASIFGAGPRRALNREERARFRYLIAVHRRAGRLTRAARDVGEALLKRLGVDGRLDPSHATLADDAGCSDRTVRRALDALRNLGLVNWAKRLVRSGWRVEQTSSAYLLALPENPPEAGPAPRRACDGQNVRQTGFDSIQKTPPRPEPSLPERAAALAALADRRRVIEQRMLTTAGMLLRPH